LNIPAQYSDFFPADSGVINVQFGPHNLNGFVDRRNNNGYPRIRVGVELRDWIRGLLETRTTLNMSFANNLLIIS